MIYCTTFNEKLYEKSGKHLLDSFSNTKSEGWFCVGAEGVSLDSYPYNVTTFNVDNSKLRAKWIRDNKDIVPKKYGGEYTGEGWPAIKKRYGTDFNFQAARWFWKIVTLDHALIGWPDEDYYVLIDSDVVFTKQVTHSFLLRLFDDRDFVCQFGPIRKQLSMGIEAGLVAFKRNAAQALIYLYMSGEFRKFERWDDSFLMTSLLNQFDYKDLVTKRITTWTNETFPYTELSDYMVHNKGIHQRSNLV